MASGGVILFGSFNEEETSVLQTFTPVNSNHPQIPSNSQSTTPETPKTSVISANSLPPFISPSSGPAEAHAPLASSSFVNPQPRRAANGSLSESAASSAGETPSHSSHSTILQEANAATSEDISGALDGAAPPLPSPPSVLEPSLSVTSTSSPSLESASTAAAPPSNSEAPRDPQASAPILSTPGLDQSEHPSGDATDAEPASPPPPPPPATAAPKPAPKSWAALVQRNAPDQISSAQMSAGGSRGLASGVPHPLKPIPASGRQVVPHASAQGSGMKKSALSAASGGASAAASGGGEDVGGGGMAVSGEGWQSSLRDAEASGNVWLKPRGLVNTGNSCFLNSTLQGLLACHPFLHLLKTVGSKQLAGNEYPTLLAFTELLKEFEVIGKPVAVAGGDTDKSSGLHGVDVGRPLVPSMFESVLGGFNPNRMRQGHRSRQEDAQEFLSFVMDRMHEELLRLEGRGGAASGAGEEEAKGAAAEVVCSTNGVEGGESEEWETVGPKNKTAVTRTHAVLESGLSAIFGGQLRSVVKSKGNKASAVVQPFLLLQLDIVADAVRSLEDALALFAAPESLEGYKVKSGKAEVVSASKAVKIQALPRVLILHLMRFSFGPQGSSKVHKPVHYPQALTVSRELLAGGGEARKYELFATVTHHGKDPGGGHYTADCKQSDGRWLRFDDGQVSHIPIIRVLHDQAYLLMYRRGESPPV